MSNVHQHAQIPTVRETLRAIRNTGCLASYTSDFKEFRVTPPNGRTETSYFTQDKLDAIETAESLAAGVAPLYAL